MASWIRAMSAKRVANSGYARSCALRQRGISLLIALLVLIIIGGTLLASVLPGSQQFERERATSEALARAKQTLIAYAVAYAQTHSVPATGTYYVPGYLPCPEVTPPSSASAEGRSSPCGTLGTSLLGRLPWAELDSEPLRDGAGQCLWYAVASTFKRRNPSTGTMLNGDTAGLFDIVVADLSSSTTSYLVGPDPAQRAVAVVFAPGAPLPGKTPAPHPNARQCQGSYLPSDYLDSTVGVDNASIPSASNTPGKFVVSPRSATFNDHLIYITAAEIFDAVSRTQSARAQWRQLLEHAAGCVVGFAKHHQSPLTPNDRRLPWAAGVQISATSLAAYDANTNYRDAAGAKSGRFPFDVRNSCKVIRGLSSCASDERQLLDNIHYCAVWNAQDQEWYRQWKDQLFYAVAFDHRADSGAATNSACSGCLSVNAGAVAYAAVIALSGKSLAGKKRSALLDKADIQNYLEGRNAGSHPNTSGRSDYQAGTASPTFNDILVCIDHDLNVISPCPPGS
jgi:type II secretory pathway pseudopilin PulG